MPVRIVSLAVLLFASCGAAPRATWEPDFEALRACEASAFQGAEELLDGLAGASTDQELRVGDAALFGVELHRDGKVERRLLVLEFRRLLPGRISATVTTTFGDGEVAENSYWLQRMVVGLGHHHADASQIRSSELNLFLEATQVGWWGTSGADPDVRASQLATAFTSSLQSLADEDETLRELLFTIVDKPSPLSLLAHFGARVNLIWNKNLAHRQLVPADLWDQPIRPLQLQVDVNGSPALLGDVLVARPEGPLLVCGGLCGAILRHPTEAGRMAVVRLLATRRGPE